MKGKFNELTAVLLVLVCVIYYFLLMAIVPVLPSSHTVAQESTTPAPASTTITDQLGRTLTLTTTYPQRIISLAPSNTEILFALGLGDRVVGVTDYCNYPPEAKTKPSVGEYVNPNIEGIVAMNPDLILGTEAQTADYYAQIESKGLTMVAISPKTFDEVLASITLIGKITGADKAAAALTASMQKRIKAVTDKTASLSPDMKPSVFYVLWDDPLMTAGKGTFTDEMIAKAGGTNIFGDLESYPTVSLENVLVADPQIMVAGVGTNEGEQEPFQFIMTESRLQDTSARQNNRVYSINMDIISRPGPRIVDALEEFAHIIHPELFP
jgi:iron complex transport system substrate-binding protein